MSCGSEFHGQWGDDPAHDPMTHDPTLDEPVNIDGDGYPFDCPPEAVSDTELVPPVAWGVTRLRDPMRLHPYASRGITVEQQVREALAKKSQLVLRRTMPHTHAPGFDSSIDTMADHLRGAHGLPAPRESILLQSWHVNDHPEGVQ